MKIQIGDVFSIKTQIGYGFLQYFDIDDLDIHQVRVLQLINENEKIEQTDVNEEERWIIGFPLKSALRKKLVNKVENYKIPKDFQNSNYRRSRHIIPNKVDGWHIINLKTSKMVFKEKLNKKELGYSPDGVFNDTLIIEYLEKDWKLKEWK